MEEKEYQKKCRSFMATTMLLLLFVAVFVFLIDPFFHYHAPWFGLRAVQTKKEYQANGALEHLQYDAILLGSSTSGNINTRVFDEAFACKTLKAWAGSASASVLCYYLDKAYKYQDLHYVFYSLDAFSLQREVFADSDQDQVIYLRDKNPFNDVYYLWNLDVLAKDIPNMIASSAREDYDEGRAYDFARYARFSYEEAISSYERPTAVDEMSSGEEIMGLVHANLDMIASHIEAHPETEYYFFLPTVSILYWDRAYREGSLEEDLLTYRTAVCRLSEYENVTFSGGLFNDADSVMNLDYYMDLAHASYEQNCRWAQIVAQKENIITAENIDTEIGKLRSMVLEFEERAESEGNIEFLREYAE